MRKLATIQRILDIQPIENADKIVKVKVKDWWVVTQKENFKIGDFCVYFEIDSLLPSDNNAFSFLSSGNKEKTVLIDGKEHKGYRLRTIRLRGQISQGLVLPISDRTLFPTKNWADTVKEGDDVTDILNVVKYEEPIPANLAGKIKGKFPGFLRKTDEERVQNLGDLIENLKKDTIHYYISEKLDGSSSTFYKKDGELGVCSRNLELLETDDNTLWKIANILDLKNKLPEGFAIQGELIGPGIQKNPLKRSEIELYVFNVYRFLDENRYLNYNELKEFCEKYGLNIVPIINEDITIEENDNVDTFLKYAEGASMLNNDKQREGIVIRPLNEMVAEFPDGSINRLSFKAISNEYLLNNNL